MSNYVMNPMVEIETANGTREVNAQTYLLSRRKLFLTGEIDGDAANAFIQKLLYLEAESDKPVTLYINSPGGVVNAGLLIYDALQGTDLEVNMVCCGMAASMAAIILSSGKKGHRFIFPHSQMMIHEPLVGGVGGSATSIRNLSESIMKTKALANELLAKHTGRTLAEIDEATSYDNYLSAEEAVEFGLVDTIIHELR